MPIPSFRHLDDGSIILEPELEELAGRVLGVVREVYREIGPGLAEPMYHEAMEIALAEAGIPFQSRPRLRVMFRGRELKRCAEPDLLIDGGIVVELKAVDEFHPRHHAQLITYLRVTKRRLGFLINFHAPRLSLGIKRMVL